MKLALLTLITAIGLSSFSFAQTVNKSNWNKLTDVVAHTGIVMQTSMGGDYMYVQDIEPADITISHVANYFSRVGVSNPNGEFLYSRIEVVSEIWQLSADGNWNINQWLFTLSPEGKVTRSMHINMVQTAERRILKHEYLAADEAATQTQWTNTLNGWYGRIGLD